MTEDQLKQRVTDLLEHAPTAANPVQAQALLSGTLTVCQALYGKGSAQELVLAREIEKARGHRHLRVRDACAGLLRNLEAELDAGLLGSLRSQITGGIITDFVLLAKEAQASDGEGSENVAAVLAAAAFEDTVRRLARQSTTIADGESLEDVLNALKDANVLIESELGNAKAYQQYRNHALHAEWDKIKPAVTATVIQFVDGLIHQHFR